jgi:hypothetical protein
MEKVGFCLGYGFQKIRIGHLSVMTLADKLHSYGLFENACGSYLSLLLEKYLKLAVFLQGRRFFCFMLRSPLKYPDLVNPTRWVEFVCTFLCP